MELVSIVIPAYNAEKTIHRCINSLLHQDYDNIQVVVINDGSTDNTDRIVKELCLRDSRIKYLLTENGGVSKARNNGLDIADGEYITFADSDDYAEKNYVSEMMGAIKKYNVDFCCCQSYDYFFRNGKKCIVKKKEREDTILRAEEYDIMDIDFPTCVWGTMIKKELLNGIRFDTDIYVSEDTLFIAKVIRNTDKIVILHKNLYHYFQYSGSSFHGAYNKKRRTEFIAQRRIMRLFKDVPNVYINCRAFYADKCLKVVRRYYFHMGVSECFYKKMLAEYRRNIKYILIRAVKKKNIRDIVMWFAYLIFAIIPISYPLYYKMRYHVEE